MILNITNNSLIINQKKKEYARSCFVVLIEDITGGVHRAHYNLGQPQTAELAWAIKERKYFAEQSLASSLMMFLSFNVPQSLTGGNDGFQFPFTPIF